MLVNRYRLSKLLGYGHQHFSTLPLERDYEFLKVCESVNTYYTNGFLNDKSKDTKELITYMIKYKASVFEYHDQIRRGFIHENLDYDLVTCYTEFWGKILPPVLAPRHN